MSDAHVALRKIVNESGFPLQMSIQHAVESSTGSFDWRLHGCEAPWFDELTQQERFADLILGRGHLRLVVECKRRTGANWVFLVSTEDGEDSKDVRCRWLQNFGEAGGRHDLGSFPLDPATPDAEFCAIGKRDGSQLERVVSELVRATDFFAAVELGNLKHFKRSDYCAYLPVVVTTADLSVCKFDPSEVSLKDGTLPEGDFESVSSVRFTRSMPTLQGDFPDGACALYRSIESTRTTLIVNAEHFVDTIESLRTTDDPEECPWQVESQP